MKFRFLLFVAMVCLPLFLGAQNDTLLLYRIRNNRSLLTDFSRAPDFNPAARAFSGRSSLHQMHIGGHRKAEMQAFDNRVRDKPFSQLKRRVLSVTTAASSGEMLPIATDRKTAWKEMKLLIFPPYILMS